MPDYERAGKIGEFYGNPNTRTFAELLIDAEEDPASSPWVGAGRSPTWPRMAPDDGRARSG
jgi:hypothetical protein